MEERSVGKDTTTGHWEIAGAIVDQPFVLFERFPDELVRAIEQEARLTFIGNNACSGTTILEELGSQHCRTGQPILYMSADSVLQKASALEKITDVHRAPIIRPLLAKESAKAKKMNAELIGRASVLLGAGRRKAEDAIDFPVGISGIKKIGENIEREEPLLTVHARNEQSLETVLPLLQQAIAIERQ